MKNRGHSNAPQSTAIIGKAVLGRQPRENLVSISALVKAPRPKPVHNSP
jgi:hypothetical protein